MRLVFPRNWRRDVKLLLFSFMAIDSFFDLRAYLITVSREEMGTVTRLARVNIRTLHSTQRGPLRGDGLKVI